MTARLANVKQELIFKLSQPPVASFFNPDANPV